MLAYTKRYVNKQYAYNTVLAKYEQKNNRHARLSISPFHILPEE